MVLYFFQVTPMIEIKKHGELSAQVKAELNSYIDTEFGHIPLVKETEWARPDWTVIRYEGNCIATFYNIVEREISIDDKTFKVGGINNVITPKAFRGHGYAAKTLKATEYLLFEDLNCDLGLLLCADNLVPFYKKLNWYTVACPVYFDQSTGKKLWASNTMLLTKKEKMDPRKIELKGLPW